MPILENQQLTAREHILLEHEKDEAARSREHAVRLKELDLALAREKYQAQVELRRLESKWSTLLRIPIVIIKLPIHIVLAVGYLLATLRGIEPSKSYWNLLS